MSVSGVLTSGGFSKIPLPPSNQGDKVRLYHLQELETEKIERARQAVLKEWAKPTPYTYLGELEAFDQDIKDRPYLLKEGKTLQLIKGKTSQTSQGTTTHHLEISSKVSYRFLEPVKIGGNFNITSEQVSLTLNFPSSPKELNSPLTIDAESNKESSICQHLANFYKKLETGVYKAQEKGKWERSFPIEGIYTSLALLTEEERRVKKQETKEACQDQRLPSVEFIYKIKTPLAPQALFQQAKLKDARQKRAVIFGIAGVGKTTFCKMIAAQAATWWPEFKAVFLVKIRNFKGDDPYQLLAEECGFELASYHTLLNKAEFRSQTLLILDGYDELPKSQEGLIDKFEALFDHILVSSRPLDIDMDYTVELEIMGFDRESIPLYIEKFYALLASQAALNEQEAKAKTVALQEILAKKPTLASLAQIPINLSLMCTLFKEEETFFMVDQNATLSSFYVEIVNWYYKWYQLRPGISCQLRSAIRRQHDPRVDEKTNRVAQALEVIAWEAMRANTLYLKQTQIGKVLKKLNPLTPELKSPVMFEDLDHMGILSLDNREGQFIHSTFQEFFAATYVAHFYTREENAAAYLLLKEVKFDPRYSLTLSMIAGYLSATQDRHPHALQAFFNHLFQTPRDLAKGYELILFSRCFEECQDPKEITQYEKEFIPSVVSYLRKVSKQLKFEILNQNTKLLHHPQILSLLVSQLENPNTREDTIDLVREIAEGRQPVPIEFVDRLVNFIIISSKGEDKVYWRMNVESQSIHSASFALWMIAQEDYPIGIYALNELVKIVKDCKVGNLTIENLLEISEMRAIHISKELKILIVIAKGSYAEEHLTNALEQINRRLAKLPANLVQDIEEEVAVVKRCFLDKVRWAIGVLNDSVFSRSCKGDIVLGLRNIAKNGFEAPKVISILLSMAYKTTYSINKELESEVALRGRVIFAIGEIASKGYGNTQEIASHLLKMLTDQRFKNYPKVKAFEALEKITAAGYELGASNVETLIQMINKLRDYQYLASFCLMLQNICEAGHSLPFSTIIQVLTKIVKNNRLDAQEKRTPAVKVLIKIAQKAKTSQIDSLLLNTLKSVACNKDFEEDIRLKAAQVLSIPLPEKIVNFIEEIVFKQESNEKEYWRAAQILLKVNPIKYVNPILQGINKIIIENFLDESEEFRRLVVTLGEIVNGKDAAYCSQAAQRLVDLITGDKETMSCLNVALESNKETDEYSQSAHEIRNAINDDPKNLFYIGDIFNRMNVDHLFSLINLKFLKSTSALQLCAMSQKAFCISENTIELADKRKRICGQAEGLELDELKSFNALDIFSDLIIDNLEIESDSEQLI